MERLVLYVRFSFVSSFNVVSSQAGCMAHDAPLNIQLVF